METQSKKFLLRAENQVSPTVGDLKVMETLSVLALGSFWILSPTVGDLKVMETQGQYRLQSWRNLSVSNSRRSESNGNPTGVVSMLSPTESPTVGDLKVMETK